MTKRVTEINNPLTVPSVLDKLSAVDVSDTTAHVDGTTKDVTIGGLRGNPNAKNALSYGVNTTPGTTDMQAAIQAAVTAAGADGAVVIPPGTYAISGPILVETDNTHIDLQSGATLVAIDGNSPEFGSVEIDDSKVGMPQLKTLVEFNGCTGSSISGGGVIDAANFVFNTTDGMSGVFVRNCTRVVVDGLTVKNVFPAGYSMGGEGSKRYSGILFVMCTACTARNNTVSNIKYEGISARMQNTDIQIIGNRILGCFEGVQSSPWYADVEPEEINLRTVIADNEISDSGIEHIVWHSSDVTVSRNFCHSPRANTRSISAVGVDTSCTVIGNTVYGTDEGSDDMATDGHVAIQISAQDPSIISDNVIKYCHHAINFSTAATAPVISRNIIWKCNIGIDVANDTISRNRYADISSNYMRVYRTGVIAQDKGPTRIINNLIFEVASDPVWVGTTTGLDLDPNSNGDTEYIISSSLPINFDTPIALPAPPNPPTTDYPIYIDANMADAFDRYSNRGELTVSSGNTTGTDLLRSGLTIVPGGGEIQVTQMSGPPVAFSWSSTSSTLTVTIASSQGSDCVFGWSMHLSGFVRS